MATRTTKSTTPARKKTKAATAKTSAKTSTKASVKAPAKAPVKTLTKAPVKEPVRIAAPTTPEPKLISVSDSLVVEVELKKKELIDLVVIRSGIKKKDAKPVIEAMLSVLGETIAEGRELNLQPFGKLRINRTIDKSNGRVIICKLRQSKPADASENESLAGTGD